MRATPSPNYPPRFQPPLLLAPLEEYPGSPGQWLSHDPGQWLSRLVLPPALKKQSSQTKESGHPTVHDANASPSLLLHLLQFHAHVPKSLVWNAIGCPLQHFTSASVCRLPLSCCLLMLFACSRILGKSFMSLFTFTEFPPPYCPDLMCVLPAYLSSRSAFDITRGAF